MYRLRWNFAFLRTFLSPTTVDYVFVYNILIYYIHTFRYSFIENHTSSFQPIFVTKSIRFSYRWCMQNFTSDFIFLPALLQQTDKIHNCKIFQFMILNSHSHSLVIRSIAPKSAHLTNTFLQNSHLKNRQNVIKRTINFPVKIERWVKMCAIKYSSG